MKKVFTLFILAVSVALQFGCTQTTISDNSNLANSSNAVGNQANATVQETQPTVYTDADTALAEGKKMLDDNKTEQSVEAFKQAVKLDPELAEAYFNLGVAYGLLEDDQPDSDTPPEETTTVTRKDKKGKKETVKLTRSQKAFDKAAEIYEKHTKKNPDDDLAFFNLGRSYNKLNKDEEAEKALRQAVKLKPEDVEYQTELGAILTKLSHYDEAVKALKKALAIDRNNAYVQDLLDKAEAGEKRIDYAVKQREKELTSQSSQSSQSSPVTKKSRNADAPKRRPTPPLRIETVPLPKPNSNN